MSNLELKNSMRDLYWRGVQEERNQDQINNIVYFFYENPALVEILAKNLDKIKKLIEEKTGIPMDCF